LREREKGIEYRRRGESEGFGKNPSAHKVWEGAVRTATVPRKKRKEIRDRGNIKKVHCRRNISDLLREEKSP